MMLDLELQPAVEPVGGPVGVDVHRRLQLGGAPVLKLEGRTQQAQAHKQAHKQGLNHIKNGNT
jgi:hypothetical protein